jgi:acetolactate synthase I/II/III large subunit
MQAQFLFRCPPIGFGAECIDVAEEARRGGLRTGGQLVADTLLAHGARRLFGVPGESYLPLLDALFDVRGQLEMVTCRHEHGASMMAEAHGKLTGEPGICLVTRGPGACNAAIGVHTALQDSTPMLLLIGQVERRFLGREAFQEVDLAAMFRPLAKHAEQIDRIEELPSGIARAWHLARSGRPGPVVLALPEDLLSEQAVVEDAPPLRLQPQHPEPELMQRLHDVLGKASRPVMLLGGGGWTEAARADILAFAEANGLPTCCGFRRHDIIDNDHRWFVGELGIVANPALVARIKNADLLLAVGTRLGEITSQGYTLLGEGGPELAHVYPDSAEIGRVFRPAIAIPATIESFAAAARRLPSHGGGRWGEWAAAARRDYLADTEPCETLAKDKALDLGGVMAHLRRALPNDAIVTVDAGNFAGWLQRFLRFGGARRLLGPVNGAMGYGVPAAIAAKLYYPERTVLACVGDGGFGMTGQELATAIQYGAAPIVLLFNNGMYGTIRMHQERAYPGRVIGTALRNPDYATLARAYRAHGEQVERTEQFAPALERAANAGRAALIELCVDPEVISTRTTITELRDGAA